MTQPPKQYTVYILTNTNNQVFYTGITSNLPNRIQEHKTKATTGFTQKYNTNRLVWHETTTDPEAAIKKEKQIKKWRRAWKIELISKFNPAWRDLSSDFD